MDFDQIRTLLELNEYLKNIQGKEEIAEKVSVKTPNIEEMAVAAEGETNGQNG